MTKKDGWEEPSIGPDWIDVEMMMRSISALHSAHVAVIVTPFGTGSTGGVEVAASALFEKLPGSSLPESVAVNKGWPCSTHKTLAAHAFALMHDLDFAISKVYQNERLWE
jgi:hypothetical protein